MKQTRFLSTIKVYYYIYISLITVVLLTNSNSILAQAPKFEVIKPVPSKIIKAKENFILFSEYNIFNRTSNDSIETNFYDKVSTYDLLDTNIPILNEIIKNNPYAISLQIPYEDTILTIQVVRNNFIAQDYELKATNLEGPIPTKTQALHYNGMVLNDNSSLVSISFFKNKIIGIISTKDFGNIVIGSINSESHPSIHIIYSDNNLLMPFLFECISNDGDFPLPANEDEALDVAGGGSDCVKIYFEADYDLYQDMGGVSETEAYIHGFFNEVATLYENESVNIMISEILVWNIDDPFPETNSYDALYYFQDYRTTFDGDLAFLITTDPGGLGGRAFLNGLCNTNSYAFADIYSYYYDFPEYSWTVKVITHEIGHNLSSHHTHWCGWDGGPIDNCGPLAGYDYETCAGCSCDDAPEPVDGGTIMSYCQHIDYIGINFLEGFGPQPGDAIREYINSAFCLGECVDFVNNDDPCDAYEISVNSACTFTTSTLVGATESAVPDCDFASNIDVWYSFIVPESGYVSINSDNIDIGSGDLVMGIYVESPDCNDLIEIFCDDYSYTPGDYMPEHYDIDLTSFSCEKVYLRFAEFGTYNADSEGDFKFCIFSDDPGCGGDCPGQADLIVSVTDDGPFNIDAGEDFQVSFSISNIGEIAPEVTDFAVYVTDAACDIDDYEVKLLEDEEGIIDLNPGEVQNVIDLDLTMDADLSGTWYLLVNVDDDDEENECNEDNNIECWEINVNETGSCPGQSDITLNITDEGPYTIEAGSEFQISFNITNLGETSTEQTDYAVYVTNAACNILDYEVKLMEDEEGINSLMSGEVQTINDLNLAMDPDLLGNYYLTISVDDDDEENECIETNNTACWPIEIISNIITNPYVYISSSGGEPWGVNDNIDAMNNVFGINNWSQGFFETTTGAEIFNDSVCFVFMEGSDGSANQLDAFIGDNLVLMENWVYNGGHLFINSAPNEGAGVYMGFSINLEYPSYSDIGYTIDPTHPIFNGPFLPVGTDWVGSSFAHGYVWGPGVDNTLIFGDPGFVLLSEKHWGDGDVLFGGMTMPSFHSPLPEAQNLRENVIAYLGTCDLITNIDLATLSITYPVTGCGLLTESITCEIQNFGPTPVTSFPVNFRVNGGDIYSETAYLTLAAGDVGNYTFSTPYDFTVEDDYLIEVWTDFLGDTNPFNDNQTITIHSYHTPSVELGPTLTACDNIILDAGNPGLNYLWNTGATTQTINVTTTGTYSVTVTNPLGGCTDFDNIYVTINHSPISHFISSTAGMTANFTNTSTYATSYFWNFGDGSTSILTNPSHTYLIPGDYMVQLTATNLCGSETYSEVISVNFPLPDIIANIISVTPTIVHPGELITITYSMSNIGDADVVGSYINRFKLSHDCVLLDDIFVRTDSHADAPDIGEVINFTIIDTIPITTPNDTYNLILATDAQEDIDEITDENNNPCYLSIIVEDTCSIYLSSPGITYDNLGGSGSFNIETYGGCNWNIESVPSWVTIVTPYFGAGASTIVFNVMENFTCEDRIGNIVVSGKLFEITQSGIEDSYYLSATAATFSNTGGVSSLYVTASTEFCNWFVDNPSPDWVDVVPGPYSGSTILTYAVGANIAGPRSTTLTIAGIPFNIEQDESVYILNETGLQFIIYPNPANNEIIIETPYQIQNLEFIIVNYLGQLMLSQKTTSRSNNILLDIEKFASGLYFIQINYNNENYKIPFVVQH